MARIVQLIAVPPSITAEQRADLEKQLQAFYLANQGRRTDYNRSFTLDNTVVVGDYQHVGLRRTIRFTVTSISENKPKAGKERTFRSLPPVDGRAPAPAMHPAAPGDADLMLKGRDERRTPQQIRQQRIASSRGSAEQPTVASTGVELPVAELAPPPAAEPKAAPADHRKAKANRNGEKETPEVKLERLLKSGAMTKAGNYYTVAGGKKFNGRKAILKAIKGGKV